MRRRILAPVVLLTLLWSLPALAGFCSCPDFTKIAEEVSPAVVNVFTTQVVKAHPFPLPPDIFGDDFFRFFFGNVPPREFKRRSLGSGFIISRDGFIVTNYHVVKNATEVRVVLKDGTEYKAKIYGTDPKTDIALLKIDPKGRDLPTVKLGDSDKLKVGEWVLAIGNPFGLSYTVTAGIVSAKGRVIGEGPYDDFIQTDASINPGNSGGPLVNMDGEVVGINTAIIKNAQGIGFAIPINLAKNVIEQLKEHGKVIRGWLGVYIQDVRPSLAEAMKLPVKHGAIITKVIPKSPADKAGLKQGDVIIEYNGREVKDSHQLSILVSNTKPGTRVKIKIIRDGKEKTLRVKIGELKEQGPHGGVTTGMLDKLGLELGDVPPDVARRLDVRGGAYVISVKPGSIAMEAGFRKGDVIVSINRHRIRDAADAVRIISKAKRGQFLTFLVYRGEGALYITIRVE